MIRKTIIFQAVSQDNIPKYEITYRFKTFYYYAVLQELQFVAGNKSKVYPLKKLSDLTEKQLKPLGVLSAEVAHIISFCIQLPPIPYAIENPNWVLQPSIIKKNVRLKIQAPAYKIKKPKAAKNEILEAAITQKKGRRLNYKKEPVLCYTQNEKTPFTKPEVQIQYDTKSGRNLHYIGFSYLRNGVLTPFKVPLEKINSIADLETRKKKAEKFQDKIHLLLTVGIAPEKLIHLGSNHQTRKRSKKCIDITARKEGGWKPIFI